MGILAAKNGADCLRINPGNIGNIDRVKEVVKCAEDKDIQLDKANVGSLEKKLQKKYGDPTQALVESAMNHVDILESLNFQILLS